MAINIACRLGGKYNKISLNHRNNVVNLLSYIIPLSVMLLPFHITYYNYYYNVTKELKPKES